MIRRGAMLALVGIVAAACTSTGPAEPPSFSGPAKTISGDLVGPPYSRLSASSVIFITAYDVAGGLADRVIARTSFRKGVSGHFPVPYEIAVPAGSGRVAVYAEIRDGGRVHFTNDRQYSQTSASRLDIPMRESPLRYRSYRGGL
ncbi:hypothetical protein OSJ77_13295 [Phyllobacterium sp. 0TCS1.6C]|uniref:hypothetical protein n=1 Tax=unclassified Phyllobacterium TaxID=2638441 RepID=UPI002264319F|nr:MULTISPECIES: hypothetical protein [unclassified Phyllobacterium]MCX8281169.1 hypothetical protein [Phyllobacterium sp. 0TCS1.6C]MCX8294544.1 hypothetical protein [Phyllobacterium sp. 0TCS1.6A]